MKVVTILYFSVIGIACFFHNGPITSTDIISCISTYLLLLGNVARNNRNKPKV